MASQDEYALGEAHHALMALRQYVHDEISETMRGAEFQNRDGSPLARGDPRRAPADSLGTARRGGGVGGRLDVPRRAGMINTSVGKYCGRFSPATRDTVPVSKDRAVGKIPDGE